jgi:hypothetical protein
MVICIHLELVHRARSQARPVLLKVDLGSVLELPVLHQQPTAQDRSESDSVEEHWAKPPVSAAGTSRLLRIASEAGLVLEPLSSTVELGLLQADRSESAYPSLLRLL